MAGTKAGAQKRIATMHQRYGTETMQGWARDGGKKRAAQGDYPFNDPDLAKRAAKLSLDVRLRKRQPPSERSAPEC